MASRNTKLKTNIGQIFLSHPKDENYTSAFTESFTKNSQSVELFVVLEVVHRQEAMVKARRVEYDKLAQTIVLAFKKTYATAPALDQETFEKALAAINLALSRLASHGKVGWYGRLNVGIGAIWDNQLFVSVTGNSLCYLVRKGEFSLVSEGLAENTTRPTKLFSNYSQGRLVPTDRVILCTHQLFNYLSLERVEEFLHESLREACSEIISALADIKTVGFVAYLFEIAGQKGEVQTPASTLLDTSAQTARPGSQSESSNFSKTLKTILLILVVFWQGISKASQYILDFLRKLFQRRSKKHLIAVIGIILAVLVANLGYSFWKKSHSSKTDTPQATLAQVDAKLTDAESALIYKDENKAISLTAEAEALLANVPAKQKDQASRQTLSDRLATLKSKLNNEIRIDNPTVLTQFPNIPTDLVHSPNGFLGFNRNSGSLAFYDFRLSETKSILKNQNTGNLAASSYLANQNSFIFYSKDGNIQTLNLTNETLSSLTAVAIFADPGSVKIQTFKVYGSGTGTRFYFLDTNVGQIYKVKLNESGSPTLENWLKSNEPSLTSGKDMAVDGGIYILFSDHLDKYFGGKKQSFALSATLPALENAQKIITDETLQNIYITDPTNARILVFDKQGKLQKQIISNKLHDLSDIFVNEKNKVIYALSGSELLQLNY